MTKLPTRQLGKNGPMVSCLGLGCMGMSFGYGKGDDEESIRVLNRALDLGCTFWDTADVYGLGANERLLAEVLKHRRNEVFLCTKFANDVDMETFKFTVRGDPEYVRMCCERSLKNLGVDVIDLYYQHRVDVNTPIEKTVAAMAELVKEGKVRYLGLSECSAETLRRAYAVHPIAAVQMEYSPWETTIEKNGLIETCRELGVAIVAYSPLGRGFLTGKVDIKSLDKDDFRSTRYPLFHPDNVDHNLGLVKKFESLAEKKGVKASQLCLSWVLAQGDDIIPIPGTKRIKYLEENIESVFIPLTKEENEQVRTLVEQVGVRGERYTPEIMKLCNL